MFLISVWRIVLGEFVVYVSTNFGIQVFSNDVAVLFRDATNKWW